MTTGANETKEQVFFQVPLFCGDPEIDALGAVAYVLNNMKNPNGEAFTRQQKLRILRWNTERVQQYG